MMSRFSICVVAGSTTSAYFAVSVMNCSLTTVNRSSRIKPSRVAAAFGHVDTGLPFHTNSTVTGGIRFASVSTRPNWVNGNERTRAGDDGWNTAR